MKIFVTLGTLLGEVIVGEMGSFDAVCTSCCQGCSESGTEVCYFGRSDHYRLMLEKGDSWLGSLSHWSCLIETNGNRSIDPSEAS